MNKSAPFFLIVVAIVTLVASTRGSVSGQTPSAGKLVVFADMALFAGRGAPRNCTLMSRYKVGEPVGFRVTVVDGGTGEPAKDATVVVHLTYGGKTVDVPARYRGNPGGGPVYPNMWSAKWIVPPDAPTGIVKVVVTATDRQGRKAEWVPFPDPQAHLTIVNE